MKKLEDSSAASGGTRTRAWAPLHDVCQANVVVTGDRLMFEPVGFMVNRKAMPALEAAVRAIQRLHDAHRRVECRGRRAGSSSAAKARDPIARLRREQRRLALASKAVIHVAPHWRLSGRMDWPFSLEHAPKMSFLWGTTWRSPSSWWGRCPCALAIPRNRAQGEALSRFCASLQWLVQFGGAKRKQREERRHGE